MKSKVKPDSHKDDGGERERDSVDHNGHSKDTKSSNVSSKVGFTSVVALMGFLVETSKTT